MQLLSVPVEDERTRTKCQLVILDRKSELHRLAAQANESVPRVLSVDGVLKASLAILQLIVLGLMTWVLSTVVNHGDRITKNETMLHQQQSRDKEMLDTLRELNKNVSTALVNQAAFKAEIKALHEKANGK